MLMKSFGFAKPESPDRLELRHNLPTLNINAMEAGGGVGGQGRTIIPATASARVDLRLVKAIDPSKQFERLVTHIKKQGYFLVEKDPDDGDARGARADRKRRRASAAIRPAGHRWTCRSRARSPRR